jgi:hypothetical protein
MNQPLTRRDLILRNVRSTALWLAVTVPVFAVTADVSFMTLGWGAISVVPFILGPAYLMVVAGLSQKTLPDAGWLWFLVLCFAGAGSAFIGVFLYDPLRSLFADQYEIWIWSVTLAAGAWVMPTLLNLGYLLSFSDEECAILTRGEATRKTSNLVQPRSASV